MLTYIDFAFLLNILSTPRRYMDIAFHAFDVSADGNCEAKVRSLQKLASILSNGGEGIMT